MNYGVASMTAPLRRVALRKPGASMQQADAGSWNYGASFDKDKVEFEHATFTDLLVIKDVEVLWMDGDARNHSTIHLEVINERD